jgi:hypothetical protein
MNEFIKIKKTDFSSKNSMDLKKYILIFIPFNVQLNSVQIL